MNQDLSVLEVNQPPDEQIPVLFSSQDFASPDLALKCFQENTQDLCDILVYGEVKDFHMSSAVLHLSGAVLFEIRASPLRYDRAARHVAKGIDNFHVTLHLAGGAEYVTDDESFLQRPGDIAIIDMTLPNLSRKMPAEDGATREICFAMPRMMFAPLTTSETNPAIRILPREMPYARIMADYMLALWRNAAGLTQAESQGAVQALAHLIIAGVQLSNNRTDVEANLSQDALRAHVKAYIEQKLTLASLGLETLCHEFGLSRASLYRLLAPQSPVGYIQQRRLHRAFAMLISPAFRAWRLIDIALECQFSSDATFIRAFRRQFGLAPGEARKLATQRLNGSPSRVGDPDPRPDAEAMLWITQLTGTLLGDSQL